MIPTDKAHLIKLILQNIAKDGNHCDLNYIDTSLIKDMSGLFAYSGLSNFNEKIDQWNTSRVENMSAMFVYSKFNNDILKWNTSKVKNMLGMFKDSNFNGDISQWNVESVEDMTEMFYQSQFTQNIEAWKPKSLIRNNIMFANYKTVLPSWYETQEQLTFRLKSTELKNKLSQELATKNNLQKIKI